MNSLLNLTREELEEYFLAKSEKKFKALQVYEWLYQKREYNIDNFSNLKKELREELKKDFKTSFITIEKRCDDKDTHKYLFKLKDDNYVEAVIMKIGRAHV